MKLIHLLHPDLVTFKCPSCAAGIPNFDVQFYFETGWTVAPFPCRTCGCLLCVSAIYAWSVFGSLSALALAIPLALGIGRWYLWLGTAALSWIFLCLLASVYVKVLVPPKILRCPKPSFPADRNDLSLNIGHKR